MLRSSVTAHEREVAERATLVTQERLVKAKVRSVAAGAVHTAASLVFGLRKLRPRHSTGSALLDEHAVLAAQGCWRRPAAEPGNMLLLQGRAHLLPDVWIRPPLGGKGRKMTGQLEAHANGFRYLGPKGEVLDIMYRCARRGCRV